MFVRPPKQLSNKDQDPLAAALEQEIFNEKASTLTRLNKKLETALEKLAEVEARENVTEIQKKTALANAGEALWHVTIQREMCGLHRHKAFFDHMGVPSTVRLKMGPASSILRDETD